MGRNGKKEKESKGGRREGLLKGRRKRIGGERKCNTVFSALIPIVTVVINVTFYIILFQVQAKDLACSTTVCMSSLSF